MSSFETRGGLRTDFPLEFPRIGQFLTESLENNPLVRWLAVTAAATGVLLAGAGCATNPEAGSLQAIPVATASPFESPSATPIASVETSPTPSPSPTPSKNSKKEKSELPKSFLAFDKLSDQAFYELTNAERDAWPNWQCIIMKPRLLKLWLRTLTYPKTSRIIGGNISTTP